MLGVYFIDLPVYRLPREEYDAAIDEHVRQRIQGLDDADTTLTQSFLARNPHVEAQWRHAARVEFGGEWKYNEIIGFIEMHFLGRQIRGEYWQVSSKRITRTRRKLFKHQTWNLANELKIPERATNAAIYDLVKGYVAACSRALKGRYIDTSRLEQIGSYVDWVSLVASQAH
ncbi:MAG: hypothetical protein IT204_21825 [Fimbriimonadaceae bacterium]|nr:hypothetical protein [Fimbriimonadaceae bacterium]